MRIFTLKNYINWLNKYKYRNKYTLEFRGDQTSLVYKFTLHNKLVLEVYNPSTPEIGVLYEVQDLYRTVFNDESLTPVKFTETSFRQEDEVYESVNANIYYPAQLYVKLFRVMKERVNFIFKANDDFYYCYYVDGKVLYVNEDDTEYRLIGTTLFELAKRFHNYEIMAVSAPAKRLSFGEYLDKENEIANKKCKTFLRINVKSNNKGGAVHAEV